jgi:hypothetical protein
MQDRTGKASPERRLQLLDPFGVEPVGTQKLDFAPQRVPLLVVGCEP